MIFLFFFYAVPVANSVSNARRKTKFKNRAKTKNPYVFEIRIHKELLPTSYEKFLAEGSHPALCANHRDSSDCSNPLGSVGNFLSKISRCKFQITLKKEQTTFPPFVCANISSPISPSIFFTKSPSPTTVFQAVFLQCLYRRNTGLPSFFFS